LNIDEKSHKDDNNNTTLGGLGGPGAALVGADYDGDGLADPAVYERATGNLFALLSGSHYTSVQVPLNAINCVPVFADYDGDRKADPMLYSEPEAIWQGALSAFNYQWSVNYLGGTGWMPPNSGW